MKDFIVPENHVGFKAIPLSSSIDDEIKDCAIAFIEPGGGGPDPSHTHSHDHLFVVVSGGVEIEIEDKIVSLKKGESFIVQGEKLHCVHNRGNVTAKVMGISLFRQA